MLGIIGLCSLLLPSCDKVDNNVLPGYSVRINLGNYALWNTYGVSGVGDHNIFIRERGIPSNFAYNANTFTGYGGVLLIMALNPSTASYEPAAYDISCPVEKRADVVVGIDGSNFDAVCARCGSHYDVLTGSGGPLSGMALDQKVGLTIYKVHATTNGGYVITSY